MILKSFVKNSKNMLREKLKHKKYYGLTKFYLW